MSFKKIRSVLYSTVFKSSNSTHFSMLQFPSESEPWKCCSARNCRSSTDILIQNFHLLVSRLRKLIYNSWLRGMLKFIHISCKEEVGVSQLTWRRKQIQFPKRYVSQFLKYRKIDKVPKPSNSGVRLPENRVLEVNLDLRNRMWRRPNKINTLRQMYFREIKSRIRWGRRVAWGRRAFFSYSKFENLKGSD
jgi:hypothetical protein